MILLCKENCICSLCRQLKSFSETKVEVGDGLKVRDSKNNCRKLTFFGMELDLNQQEFEKFSTIGKKAKRKLKRLETPKKTELSSRHKSVIYVNEAEDLHDRNIKRTEEIDSDFTLELLEHCQVLNVVSQSTFSYACQLLDEVTIGSYRFYEDDFDDDFPLGMEADMISEYLSYKRLSSNSRTEHANFQTNVENNNEINRNTLKKDSSRVHTPANISNAAIKPAFTPTATEQQTTSERMVSPKRKVEPFQHLFVANNVKTSTFSEQIDKSNLSTTKNNLNNNAEYNCSHASISMVPERDTGPNKGPGHAFGNLRIAQNQLASKFGGDFNSGDEHRMVSGRKHYHVSVQELRLQQQSNNSSSDENRSSGHASMSDTGHSSPRDAVSAGNERLNAGVMIQKPIRSKLAAQHGRSRHRATPARLHVPWSGSGGLEDIKLALQQLTLRSHTSTSTYSSVSAGSESSEPAIRRLMRHSSLETINTNVTSADEFVWVDSHNRLVELQHLPWSNHCILRVLQSGRCKEHMARVSVETIPRLSYLLQRALVRMGRETQRLSSTLGICTKHDITISFRIVLCPPLADSCIKACLRAAAMLAVSGDCTLKQSKSSRAGLQMQVGRFHRWMKDVNLTRFIHEYAAVYLCAGIENLLEEILLQCLPSDSDVNLTATLLEHAIANNGDLWGLLQPYAHLNAGRIASGALALPRWASVSSVSSGRDSGRSAGPPETSLMTTCVGSLQELQDLIGRMKPRIPLCPKAISTLFYFMRCSQLEHGDQGNSSAVQELCYERAYVVLPPLVEWLRVATAHGEHRFAAILDKDDIMQAARLLLPGVDCPVRALGEEAVRVRRNNGNEEDQVEATKQIQVELAFRLMLTGRPELIQQAVTLLPVSTRLDTLNPQGHTALMLAAVHNDETTLIALLDAGASLDTETPSPSSPHFVAVNGENQHWTALTYAASKGHVRCARALLERGANVEGGATASEEKITLTPLQVACGSGNVEIVALLCAHGAQPFFSTQIKDMLSYSASTQRGCYSALSVAAAHGHRVVLQKLLAQPLMPINKEVLSLEEMLAEGAPKASATASSAPQFTKPQIKALQEAMYHSAENNHLDITVEIRTLGVPWTLHCWMHSLGAAHEARLDCVIDQLLQDFLQVCPEDYGTQFVQECLPLLFNIFRYSKKEGTTLLLADIFSTCFGWEPIKLIKECMPTASSGSRIDTKYVNNPELSDVTFRVEGRLFYAHKIVLVTASPRLRAMLSSKLCEGGLPTVQINDIRYHIFQIVMQFLYQGGCQTLEPASEDILELMAAANFFQLDGLLRYCESRCAAMVALDNVVSMYIHAKVYNALRLLEYCQGFLLQNMVALLTYDDSVKRLLFAKKLPNHDVLAGLLLTLQNRIKARKSQSLSKMSPQNAPK
ncbi:ankyrin repeat and BTB/POZ domain-containing protein 2 isoform X1 [Dendroctonus ponderosae]|uniref:ankyrin repeat and BTB/POZ domain-containing protein 2 isoform X1 n=1 Tax=Dendroctonus ponderosae TaxID=77166 RepID=UPI0020359DED|nr:ankyrin repeat and BTB/POZ domain-containing protein 2 isoform X1 [Dendroctonus ponderosae]